MWDLLSLLFTLCVRVCAQQSSWIYTKWYEIRESNLKFIARFARVPEIDEFMWCFFLVQFIFFFGCINCHHRSIIIFIFAIEFGNFLEMKLTSNWNSVEACGNRTLNRRNGSSKNNSFLFRISLNFAVQRRVWLLHNSIHNISWQMSCMTFSYFVNFIRQLRVCDMSHFIDRLAIFTISSPIIISKWLGKCIKHKNGVKANRTEQTEWTIKWRKNNKLQTIL